MPWSCRRSAGPASPRCSTASRPRRARCRRRSSWSTTGPSPDRCSTTGRRGPSPCAWCAGGAGARRPPATWAGGSPPRPGWPSSTTTSCCPQGGRARSRWTSSWPRRTRRGRRGGSACRCPSHRRPTDWERSTAGLESARWATADMAYRRAALLAVDGFDERFPRAYREDADLALRVQRAGWRLAMGLREVAAPGASGRPRHQRARAARQRRRRPDAAPARAAVAHAGRDRARDVPAPRGRQRRAGPGRARCAGRCPLQRGSGRRGRRRHGLPAARRRPGAAPGGARPRARRPRRRR